MQNLTTTTTTTDIAGENHIHIRTDAKRGEFMIYETPIGKRLDNVILLGVFTLPNSRLYDYSDKPVVRDWVILTMLSDGGVPITTVLHGIRERAVKQYLSILRFKGIKPNKVLTDITISDAPTKYPNGETYPITLQAVGQVDQETENIVEAAYADVSVCYPLREVAQAIKQNPADLEKVLRAFYLDKNPAALANIAAIIGCVQCADGTTIDMQDLSATRLLSQPE